MNGKVADLPQRLRAGGGSDLERRLLDAMAHEQAPPEICNRVANALSLSTLGLSVSKGGTAPSSSSLKTAASATTSSAPLLPWFSAALVGVAVAGVIVGTRVWNPSYRAQPTPLANVTSASADASAPPTPIRAATVPTNSVAVGIAEPRPSASAVRVSRKFRATTPATGLGDETALVDAARAAVSSGAINRALSLVRQYEEKYPTGNIRPEASAIKIEALTQLGRNVEARALARRFKAEYGPGPLSERVARIAGLTRPE